MRSKIDHDVFDEFDFAEFDCSRNPVVLISFTYEKNYAKRLRIPGLEIGMISHSPGDPDEDVIAFATRQAVIKLADDPRTSFITTAEENEPELDKSRDLVNTPNKINLPPPPDGNSTTLLGDGTAICVIDSSFDIFHRSFRHANGRTRFASIFVLDCPYHYLRSSELVLPGPGDFSIGNEFTREWIDYALGGAKPTALVGKAKTLTRKKMALYMRLVGKQRDPRSRHGTHVAGIAAGNGYYRDPATGTDKKTMLKGLAPHADLVGVISSNRAHIQYGLRYFNERVPELYSNSPKAIILGSVNVSMGNHSGSHTERSPTARMVKKFANSKTYSIKGKTHKVEHAAVFSMGNKGDDEDHAEGKLKKGEDNKIDCVMKKKAWNAAIKKGRNAAKIRLWAGYGGLNGDFAFSVAVPGTNQAKTVQVDGGKVKLPGDMSGWARARQVKGRSVTTSDRNLQVLTLTIVKPKRKMTSDLKLQIKVSRVDEEATETLGWHLWCTRNKGRIKCDGYSRKTTHGGYAITAPIAAGSFQMDGGTPVISDFSSRGPDPNGFQIDGQMVAPGFEIEAPVTSHRLRRGVRKAKKATIPPYFGNKKGTSMSAPHIAGAMALMKQANPKLTLDDIKGFLKATADARPVGSLQEDWGAGRLNVGKAVESAGD